MSWSVTQISRNVHRIDFPDVSAGWSHRVLLRSDVHHDSTHCRRDIENKHLKQAREHNAPIIDIGDLFDVMGGPKDPRRSESGIRNEHKVEAYFNEIVDTTAEDYADYADLFAVMGLGNHETAAIKHHGISVTPLLTRALRDKGKSAWPLTGGYGGYVLFNFHIRKTVRHTVRLHYFHGAGGGGEMTHGTLNIVRNAAYLPDAHIIATGHIHYGWAFPYKQDRITQAGRVYPTMQWHISLPGYKDEYDDGFAGYHIEKGRKPRVQGAVWLDFSYNGSPNAHTPIRVKPDEDFY